jgi:RHS repeat-associated protein
MVMPGRKYSAGSGYRYGFNGKEVNTEILDEGNSYDFGSRIEDSRIGRWFSTDKLAKPAFSSYEFARGNPINYLDPDGRDEIHFYYRTEENLDKNGKSFVTITITSQVIENGDANKTFFVHNLNLNGLPGSVVQIKPFIEGSNLPDQASFSASENGLPLAPVTHYLWGLATNYTDDYEFLGRLLQVDPTAIEYYKNKGDKPWNTALNGALGQAKTAEFAKGLLGKSEAIFAIIDGYYAIKGVLTEGLTGVAKLIKNAETKDVTIKGSLSSLKGKSGVYVHEFESGTVYVGQAEDLATRPKRSLTELLDNTGKHKGTATKAGDTYSGTTRFIELEGSGYKNLNELESAVLKEFGGTMKQGGKTYNIKRIPNQ